MFSGDVEKGDMLIPSFDWRRSGSNSHVYSQRYSVIPTRLHSHFFTVVVFCGFLVLVLYYRSSSNDDLQRVVTYGVHDLDTHSALHKAATKAYGTPKKTHLIDRLGPYNATYPMTKPSNIHNKMHFKVAVISDLDQKSKSNLESNTWVSYYMYGNLVWDPEAMTMAVTWDKNNYKTLKTSYGHKGRGMELSELVTFDGKLYSFDDRSGIAYLIEDDKAYPWLILTDCEGKATKGFKSEWSTVKDEHLYVGGMGKEWTSGTGEYVNDCPMFVKRISRTGEIESLNWAERYKAIRRQLGIEFPGYMIHESAVWSDVHRRWFFLPRRASKEEYNEDKDELMGTNVLISVDDEFTDFKVVTIGEVLPSHGASSFKFVPGTRDNVIVALRTTEVEGKTATYIMAFTIDGKILAGETKIGDLKYEGFEFV